MMLEEKLADVFERGNQEDCFSFFTVSQCLRGELNRTLIFFLCLFMSIFLSIFTYSHSLSSTMVISNIKIRGNFPVFEKELRRVIYIRRGEEYNPERVKDVAEKIEKVFLDEGYAQVKVEPRIKQEGAEPEVTLIYVITKGLRTRISAIAITDDRPEKGYDLKRLLDIREGGVFKERKFKERIKKLEEGLVRLGYLKADVRYLKTFRDEEIKLEIYVHRGAKVNVGIEGNRSFNKEMIQEVMPFYEDRFFDQWEIEESVRRLKDFYLDEGFLDVQADAELTEEVNEKGDKNVTFKIQEGKRYYLKGVEFENNQNIKTRKLKQQLLSMKSLSLFRSRPFNALMFDEDVKAIGAFYHSYAYPYIKVSPEIEKTDRHIKAKIIIEEGIREMAGRISFQGNRAFAEKELRHILKLKEGSPLYPEDFENDKRELGIFYANNGYPYTTINVTVERKEERGVTDISYQIEEGSYVRFGRTSITRNLKTKEKIIRLACAFKEGEPFSFKKIIDTQERLSYPGIFEALSINPIGLDEKREVVDCLIEVEEMDTGHLDFGAGFSSRVGYRGYVELREDNLWGKAISGSFKADYSGLGQNYSLVEQIGRSAKYTLTFKNPLFFPHYKIEGEGKLYASTEDRREYHTRSYGLSFGTWRSYKRKLLRVGLTYHIDLNRLTDITINPGEIPEKYSEHTISAIGPTIIYDSRDNFLDPHKGIYATINIDWAGNVAGGDQNFYKLQGEWRAFLPLSPRFVFALSVRYGSIGLYSNTPRVPIQERFFAGGSNTLRGFKEDSLGPIDTETGLPLGGRSYWINNLEFRYPLYKEIKGILFFDTGNVWETRKKLKASDLRQGAGAGLRFITPIGPVRFDYGFPIDRKSGESKSRAYLSIGHAF